MLLVPTATGDDLGRIVDGAASELGGLVGWAASLMTTFGEWGVGLFTLLESVFPPIPSEVILPLAGFLSEQGELNLALVIVTSTLGAYVGALALYWLGAALGQERAIRWLSRLPLVDRRDFEKGADWFVRHGKAALFFGRLIPGVRSVISLPAGASRIPLTVFSLFTIAGSAIWNSALVGLGAALGTQYALIERYSAYLNYAVYAAIAGVIVWLLIRRARRRARDAEATPR
jgi:membrane protein DedA with SNARE-associated domain